MAFVSTNQAPGVYIVEVQLPGPISGAPTSTAAFVGPAQMGPYLKPTLLSSAQEFAQQFGSYIVDPQTVYATHGVNGFFNEGGGLCYFVRVGTGAQASLPLNDSKSKPTLVVTALQEGTGSNNITVQVDAASIVSTQATRKQVTLKSAKGTQAVVTSLADAQSFNPGDTVQIEDGTNTDLATVASIDTTALAINLTAAIVNTYASGDIRTADLVPGQKRIRVDKLAGIEPGTYVTLAQGATTEDGVVRTVDALNSAITLTNGLVNTYGNKSTDTAVSVKSREFQLTIVWTGKTGTEVFPNLAMDSRHSRYFGDIVNSAAVSVDLADPPTTTPPAGNLPATIAATKLTGGLKDDMKTYTTNTYHAGIDTLLRINDAALLIVPDAVAMNPATQKFDPAFTQDIQAYMVAHSEKVVNRFAILDALWDDPNQPPNLSGVLAQRSLLNSERGMASLYYPWISISNPLGSGRVLVPPSGHVAGVYANNDNTRGVFKAPANEPIVSALDLAHNLTDPENGELNEPGVCVIRAFPGQGIRIWGARTIAPTDVTQWRYNSIRRFVNFVEASLRDGTRFAVFEPNNPTLWGTLKRLVTDFLTTQWQAGALEGTSPDQGFIVKVDATLNTPEVIALGQVIIQVTLATVAPAEFVVFTIINSVGGLIVSE